MAPASISIPSPSILTVVALTIVAIYQAIYVSYLLSGPPRDT